MIRIGIIGTDASSHLHAKVLLTGGAYEIVGCYAQDNRESMLFARKYRIVSYSSPDALFRYADAIDIAADFTGIVSLAEKSLKALKHVHIAHPHHLRWKDMQYLVRVAEESGVTLHLGGRYNHCSVHKSVAGLKQTPQWVKITHHPECTDGDFNTIAQREMYYDLIFAMDVANMRTIIKIDEVVKTENTLYCRIEGDNGTSVSLSVQPLTGMPAKMELRCGYPDVNVKADMFAPMIEKQYIGYNVTDSVMPDKYNELEINKQQLRNFAQVMTNNQDVTIERHLQCCAVVDILYATPVTVVPQSFRYTDGAVF
ncbi:MAG: Gfo/Idh/MocA family oxidoreductase [Bacteroidales bacterium]|jgi:hypothetical protein|nr:Gfo/Idh/MocA family oxidoreductase [Bacteroidales bacterium]